MGKKYGRLMALHLVLLKLGMAAEAVWAPSFDQDVQNYFEACFGQSPTPLHDQPCNIADDPYNHPDYGPEKTGADRAAQAKDAVATAYRKGIRTIDVKFVTSPSTQPAGLTGDVKAYHDALTTYGGYWVNAVDDFNKNSPYLQAGDYLKLRIRIELGGAGSSVFRNVLYRRDPIKYAGLNADPAYPGRIKNAIMEKDGSEDPYLLDLANPIIRSAIQDYVKLVLDGVYSLITSPNTKVEQVVITFDDNGESGIWASDNDNKLASFQNRRYPGATASFQNRVAYFLAKERILKSTYAEFANTVHAYQDSTGINHGLKAAIFYQDWSLDGRGGFDLAGLLRGTGIDVLHHTQPPFTPDQSLRVAAYSSSIAKSLGISFDTEFSWAHFHGQTDPFVWDASYLTVDNAINFYYQGVAGFNYGASGMTYASWTQHDIAHPPVNNHWYDIIGSPFTQYYTGAYLTSTGNPPGLFTISQLPSSGKVIYVSKIGRIECEEKMAHSSAAGYPCNVFTYLNWFTSFGLPFSTQKVDIITDEMVKMNPAIFDQYNAVYVPFETSRYTESGVYNILKAKASVSSFKQKFKYQKSQLESGTGTFDDWLSATTRFNIDPAGPAINLLLLN